MINTETKQIPPMRTAAWKEFYMQRMRDHIAADELVAKTTYDASTNKGCFIGCCLNDYSHAAWATELGAPEWLAKLCDKIFENMPPESRADFSINILEAVLDASIRNIDFEIVKRNLMIFILEFCLQQFDNTKYPDVVIVINEVITLYQNNEQNKEVWEKAAYAAADAAYAAADAAKAAYAAYAAAEAANAAEAAADAAFAAYAAAEAAFAAEAANAGAYAAAYKLFANKLISLIKAAAI